MPKRTDIHRILVIGSGPIVIGQAAEFDYAGTQACLALKEEGYEVVLCNSNPATIMTDTSIADEVYMEPLTLEYIAKILRYERPDAIVPGIAVMIVRSIPKAAPAVIRIIVLVVTAVLFTLIGAARFCAWVIIMICGAFSPRLARAQAPLLRAVPRWGLFPPTRRCLLLRGIVWPCVLARP